MISRSCVVILQEYFRKKIKIKNILMADVTINDQRFFLVLVFNEILFDFKS